MQTIAQSLVAPVQQYPPPVSAVRVRAVAQQTMPPRPLIPSRQTVGQLSAITAPPRQPPNPVPVLIPSAPVPVASSPVRVDVPADIPASAPRSFPEVDPYVAILGKKGQILEKLADTTRATAVKPVVPKPPEQYKLKADIRSWLSQFDTYLSLTRVEESNKAQYLLTNLSSKAYEQVSKAQWPAETLSEYNKLKEALKLKFGTSENPMLFRSQFTVAERAEKESAVNFLDGLRDLLKRGYPETDVEGLEPLLLNQFTRGLKLAKASEALILEPPIDSVPALKVARKCENLKLIEEKDSLFASNASLPSGNVGNARGSDRCLVAPRAPVPEQSNQACTTSF